MRTLLKKAAGLAVVGALVFVAGVSRAEDAAAVEQARTFFNAGAQAYAAGQYGVAVEAFQEAVRLAPRPNISFSLAQSLRRQYVVTKDAPFLERAIRAYREYLQNAPTGARRAEAADALAELEGQWARLDRGPVSGAGVAPPPAQDERRTRLMVTSQTAGATAQIDDGAPAELPRLEEVKPGRHRIVLRADGHFDESRDVTVPSGLLVPLDVGLRERPGVVRLEAPAGTEVAVDGRVVGTLPLARPLELPAGPHLLALGRTGHKAVARNIVVARGQTLNVPVTFDVTTQRLLSYGVLSAGAVAVVTGGLFAVLALTQDSTAQDVLDERARGNIPAARLEDYRRAVAARDDDRAVATATLGGGAALLAIGGALYAFDRPNAASAEASPAPPLLGAPPGAPPPPRKDGPRDGPVEMGAAPWLSPSVVGVSLRARF